MTAQPHDDNDSKDWREFQQLAELYKFYLDLVVREVAAYFAIVGIILTVVLTNVDGEPIVAVALLVPVLLSLLLGIGAIKSKKLTKELSDGLGRLGDALSVEVKPHSQILDEAVTGLAVLMLVAATLLAGLFSWLTFVS